MIVVVSWQTPQFVSDAVHRLSDQRMATVHTDVREALDKVSVLPRSIAVLLRDEGKRAADPEADQRLRRTLMRLLKQTGGSGVSGLYIAFEDRDYKDLIWVDLQRGENARFETDYHREDLEENAWYFLPKHDRDHRYVVSPVFRDPSSNKLMISVTSRVEDDQGQFLGVAGADLWLEKLDAVLAESLKSSLDERANQPEGTQIYLVERRTDQAGAAARDIVFADSRRLAAPRWEKDLPGLEQFPGGARVARSDEGYERVGDRVIAWHQIPEILVPGPRTWKVVLNLPASDLEQKQPAQALVHWLIGHGVGFLLILGVILYFMSGRILEPIRSLSLAAAAVESGDYRPNGLGALSRQSDVFGQLARGFQRMVAEVASREEQLVTAKDDLARRERHFRSLIEHGSDLITLLDADGFIRYESPSLERLLGHTPDALEGRRILDLVHPEDRDQVEAAFRRTLGRPGVQPRMIQYRFQHANGSYRVLESSCTNLLAEPAVAGLVVNSRDVTDRRQAEEQIRLLNADLEDRVRNRTTELAQKNEELLAAKEATDLAMKQQEIFLNNVAHDLRTPLTVVIGYSEDLLRRAKKKGYDALIPDLNLIVSRGNDLLELINDLLQLSRAMNDKAIELNVKSFGIAAALQARMEGIETIARKNGNTVVFQPSDGLGTMVGDDMKLWRILMNLLTNACKFTKDGRITVTADRRVGHDGEDDQIVITVRDTGMGMSPEQQAQLFHRFAQVHEGSARILGGVGLGLSICSLYCRIMGGHITVDSAVGKGTTFTLTLPAELRPDRADAPVPSPDGSQPARLENDRPRDQKPLDSANLVLIIDDDSNITELMQRNLGEEGFATRAARSGEEGLLLAKQLLPSAIILDVVMPGIDGWAVLAALKTDVKTCNIPVIMVSMLDERERGLKLGADEYVTKPLPRDRLNDLLHKYLGGRTSARILLAEDDRDLSRRIVRMLSEQGWQVDAAGDGAEALRLFHQTDPDIILLDLMLPRPDGFELIEEFRRADRARQVPIIVITAHDLDLEARRRLEGQVEQVLQKGLFGRDELLQEIRGLVTAHRRQASSQPELIHAQGPVHRG
jgi:PAS domain S-box-containing protein